MTTVDIKEVNAYSWRPCKFIIARAADVRSWKSTKPYDDCNDREPKHQTKNKNGNAQCTHNE